MRLLKLLLVSLFCVVGTSSALAQSTATPVVSGYLTTSGCSYGQTSCWLGYGPGFNASGQVTLTASTSSSNVALGSTGPQIIVTNSGAVTAYVALGGSGVTATTSSIPVLPGFPILLQAGIATYIAGITGSSTAGLTITSGTGVPSGIGAAQSVTGLVANGCAVATGCPLPTNAPLSPSVTGPTSTLTLTSTTTAYSAGQLIASSATAGSVVVPSFAIATAAGGVAISRVRLTTNDTTSTAWGGATINVDLWLAAPTFTNGDRATWSPATGTASHFATFNCTMSAEYGDGAYAECAPNVGSFVLPKLASGTSVYWTLEAISASGVTGASKAFTLTPELLN